MPANSKSMPNRTQRWHLARETYLAAPSGSGQPNFRWPAMCDQIAVGNGELLELILTVTNLGKGAEIHSNENRAASELSQAPEGVASTALAKD